MAILRSRSIHAVLEHGLVFVGDLLPYGTVFLLTLAVGYVHGLETTATFSLSYAYAAIVTALVCSPSLLSIRRQMPISLHPGAVALSALVLRAVAITIGALCLVALLYAGGGENALGLTLLLLVSRFFETATDAPATIFQYKRKAIHYLALRSVVFASSCASALAGVFLADRGDVVTIALAYFSGSVLGFVIALLAARSSVRSVAGFGQELSIQIKDFGRFFVATALYMVATRLHPIVISLVSGPQAAGQFAMVQNLFASIALAATGIAGVFFWSKNRMGAANVSAGIPWVWLMGAALGGLALGGAGALAMDYLFLLPLGSAIDLRIAAWLLCLSTPMLLTQSILSNFLVLAKRDREMLLLSIINGLAGLVLMAGFTFSFGLVGAALSVGVSAFVATVLGALVARRTA